MRKESTKKEPVIVSPKEKEFNKTSADIKKLTIELNEKNSMLSNLSDIYLITAKKVDEINKEYSKSKAILNKATADIDSANVVNKEIIDYTSRLNERKAIADKELSDYKNSLLLKQEVFKTNLETERTILLTEKRKTESTITEVKISLENFNNSLAIVKLEIAKVKEELEALYVNNNFVIFSIDKNIKINSDLKEKSKELTSDVSKLIQSKQDLVILKDTITNSVKEMTCEVSELRKDIDTRKSTMGRLFVKEEELKEQAHLLRDFYIKNGMKIPTELKL